MMRGIRLLVLVGVVAFAGIIWSHPAAGSDGRRWKSGSPPGGGAGNPTFNNEVVRIFQRSCQSCHHPGDIAPFSLMTWKEARPWAAAIREQVALKQMPPWKPAADCGDFADARGLTPAEIATIVDWVDAGAPEGSPVDLPPPLEFPDGWSLGTPDLVIAPDADYAPPREGDMYRCFSVPTGDLRGDRWIGALTVKPGNPRIVHHVIAYGDPNGESAALDARDAEPGYRCFGGPGISTTQMLGGWAPGSRGYFAPDGTGIKLTNRSRVIVQVHYHPTGEVERDRTQLGIYYARQPVTRELQALPLVNTSFTIPAGAKNHEVTASFTVPSLLSAKMWAVTPHMHLLGKSIRVELTRSGSTTPECLVNIPKWDFNWQGTYLYKRAIDLTPGTRLRLVCNFDNSTENPFNPRNPPQSVRWGEETTDEMALAFIGYTLDMFALPLSAPTLSEARVDDSGRLQVSGGGFQPGADILINGERLRDTEVSGGSAATRLASSEFWKVFAPPGATVEVAVVNPDGVRTPTVSLVRPGQARAVAAVSAASYNAEALAPEAIAAAFGSGLATSTEIARTQPLPDELAGTRVRINGLLAPLFFVSPGQVNFLVPSAVQSGRGVIEILAGDQVLSRGAISIGSVVASLFTANATGSGAPAALTTRDGLTYAPVGNPDGSSNAVAGGDYLVLFGTGFRKASPGVVTIRIGDREAPVLYAGPQGGYAGLDQLNTRIPEGLSGVVNVEVTIGMKTANRVTIQVR
ncbi:MAG: hypothetical protein ACK5RR_02310 [Acidobacteriota bacterium]